MAAPPTDVGEEQERMSGSTAGDGDMNHIIAVE